MSFYPGFQPGLSMAPSLPALSPLPPAPTGATGTVALQSPPQAVPTASSWRAAYMPQNRIPVQYYPGAQSIAGFNTVGMNRYRAETHKEKGNEYRKVQLPYMAIAEYQKAVAQDPTYTDALYNLGRTYIVVGDGKNAVKTFENLLRVNPEDHEARISLAEQLTQQRKPDQARQHYQFILSRSPNYDPASRNLGYLDAMTNAQSPFMAQFQVQGRGHELVKQAKVLLKNYYTQRGDMLRVQRLDQLQYDFSPTQRVKQIPNLAEYDHMKGTIRFAPELAFSSVNVVATYLAHELTHAVDGDMASSILEEQDAYREQAKVWRQLKGAVIEPNLDLAVRYYNESADRLDQAVREIYTMRDPLISEKSPGHGMPYPTMPAMQQAYIRSDALEKNFKYTDWVYRQIKSLLPAYGIR